MKLATKRAVEKLVKRISSGQFGRVELRALFMDLRAYARSSKIFLEIGDFVAHPDRDRGMIKDWFNYALAHSELFYEIYCGIEKPEISKELPNYQWTRLKYLTAKFSDWYIGQLGISRAELATYVSDLFEDAGENKILLKSKYQNDLEDSLNRHDLLRKLDEILSDERILPCFEQKDIINHIIYVLQLNNIQYDKSLFLAQTEKLIQVLIVELHNSSYAHSAGRQMCYIGSYIDKELAGQNPFADFNRLCLMGYIPWENEPVKSIFIPYLLTTTLQIVEYCDEEILSNFAGLLDLSEVELYINDDGKIGILS